MSLLRTLVTNPGSTGGGAPPPPPAFPTEYVFTEGTAPPYDLEYEQIPAVGPYVATTSTHPGPSYPNSQRKLARMSDGTLYLVYHKDLAGRWQIYVKQSTDEGATWTDDTRISTYANMASYHQLYPSIAVDSDDYLHVVWFGNATGYPNEQIWYAKYTDSWAGPVRISTGTDMEDFEHYNPSIAVDSNDYLHVVWHGANPDYERDNQIWYTKYTASWSAPVRISTYAGMDSEPQTSPCIAVDGNDYIHVAWRGRADGFAIYQIWYNKYTDSWAGPVRISTYANMAENQQFIPSIAVDSDDYIHVVWDGIATGYLNPQIWYAKYTDSWSAPVRISDLVDMEDYGQGGPTIFVDSDDYIHVLWYGTYTGYVDFVKVWYAVYTDSWADPVVLQPTGQNKHPNLRWSRWP